MGALVDSNTTAGTIGGKSFWDDDVEEHFFTRGGDSSATRTITCRWDDRLAIVAALAGGTTINGVVQINTQPMTYPDATWLYVKGIHPEGVGVRKVGVNGMVGYDFAKIKIDYGVLEKDFGSSDDVGAMSLDISNEIISPPRDQPTFRWADDASGSISGTKLPVEATPAIPISTADFEKSLNNVAALPVPTVISLLDHVNGAVFEGAAKGKVIYKGCRTFRKITALGVQNWNVAHRFIYRTVEWNKFLSPKTGKWEPIVYWATNQPLFPFGDFAQLFQTGAVLPGQINGL